VHGQTTWTGSLNPLFREISVRRIADLLALDLKQEMELFVGEPGTVYTISAIKAKVESVMKEARDVGLITDGVDNAGNPQAAYRNILVKFNSASGICYVEVEASPVTPINYVLVTAHFRATNIVA
jgi:phage tail sheath protein FI